MMDDSVELPRRNIWNSRRGIKDDEGTTAALKNFHESFIFNNTKNESESCFTASFSLSPLLLTETLCVIAAAGGGGWGGGEAQRAKWFRVVLGFFQSNWKLSI